MLACHYSAGSNTGPDPEKLRAIVCPTAKGSSTLPDTANNDPNGVFTVYSIWPPT